MKNKIVERLVEVVSRQKKRHKTMPLLMFYLTTYKLATKICN